MKNRLKHRSNFSLMLLFVAIIMASTLTNLTVVCSLMTVFMDSERWMLSALLQDHVTALFGMQLLMSLPTGVLIAIFAYNIPMKPFRRMIDYMHDLADGNFSARLNGQSILWKIPAYKELSDSFNMLADELEATELLRSDFINNFSHEFKTPIVSIAGFAKLLRKGNLSPEQQAEYLEIIEEESMRLSYMATNVLNLTKIENQTILTDISTYNLAEQIRNSILLLVNKWEPKDIDLQLDLDELDIEGGEELLKQVWINLLDNAIKFTPRGGMIAVSLKDSGSKLTVTVTNHGSQIPPQAMKRIFNKFYQADESHASEGNGVGLAIVKRVTDLHKGTVSVASENMVTSFTVTLPKIVNK